MTFIPKPKITHPSLPKNELGLTRRDYEGALSTLCAGCGHDSITAAIIEACWGISARPENVVKLLNHYLEGMTRIITKYGGTIDEFIGDAILVVFGAPVALDKAEARAVACAIEMLNSMPEVNRWNVAQGLPTVEMGIGIHSGEALTGNVGSNKRKEYTVIGDVINVASRIEQLNKQFQTEILVSDEVRAALGNPATLIEKGEVAVKGRERPVRVFSLT